MVENREIIRGEANLKGYAGGKYPYYPSANTESTTTIMTNECKNNTTFLMRTITLRGVASGETQNRREGTAKHLSDAKFQARKEKGLCFQCNEKYSHDHKCKAKEQRELRMFVVKAENEEFEIIEEEA